MVFPRVKTSVEILGKIKLVVSCISFVALRQGRRLFYNFHATSLSCILVYIFCAAQLNLNLLISIPNVCFPQLSQHTCPRSWLEVPMSMWKFLQVAKQTPPRRQGKRVQSQTLVVSFMHLCKYLQHNYLFFLFHEVVITLEISTW